MAERSFLYALLMICQLLLTCNAGPQCYSCDNVAQAQDCSRITTCGNHQKCFAQRLIGSRLNEYFKLGCIDTGVCAQGQFSLFGLLGSGSQVGRRNQPQSRPGETRAASKRDGNTDDMVLCLQCCDGDNCNNHLCGAPPAQFRRCFNCEDVNDPKGCEHVTECDRDEQCSVHKKEVATHEFHYKMSCMSNYQCSAIAQAVSITSSTLGCYKCCNGSDYCNFNVCDGWVEKTQAPTGAIPTHGIVVPSTHTHVEGVAAPTPPQPAPIPRISGTTSVSYNGYLNIECHVTSPVTHLVWDFNGDKTLPAGASSHMNGQTLVLNIPNLNESNAGSYGCLAVTSDGQLARAATNVSIKAEPARVVSLVRGPQGALMPGETITMQCIVTGYPKPTVRWTFLAIDGTNGIPTDVEFSTDKLHMVVSKPGYASMYHDGKWTCSATNYLATSEKHVLIP